MVVAVRRCWHDRDPPVKTIDPARMKRVTETASSLNLTIEKRERERERERGSVCASVMAL